MAQKTVVTVVCDLPHDGEIEGSETVSFAFDGTGYEIDVCATHAKDLREKFGKYVEHARRGAHIDLIAGSVKGERNCLCSLSLTVVGKVTHDRHHRLLCHGGQPFCW